MRPVFDAHLCSEQELFQKTASREHGLTEKEAAIRLQDDGPNRLPTEDRPSFFRRLISAIADPMVLVLLAAALISAMAGEWTDSLIIAVVIFINALLELYQEGKAEQAVEALSRMNAPQALVRREGKIRRVNGEELVIGDLVLLEPGDAAPADIRLISARELMTDQSSLTGESLPVEKRASVMESTPAPAERENLVYMGSPILKGRGEGIVVACGGDTATGRIAGMLKETERSETPLQKKLTELSRVLSLAVLIISLLVFFITLITAETHTAATLLDSVMLALSLAVAAIPEGLVVVVTLVLSLGMRSMSREGGMIRRLNAVETLGAAQVICSDKTGTLTCNRMQVVEHYAISPNGLMAAALCNSLEEESTVPGDPTETAIRDYAAKAGFEKKLLLERTPLLSEMPFDSVRKCMSTLHKEGDQAVRYAKGAPERILALADRYEDSKGNIRVLDDHERQRIMGEVHAMAEKALRVLALGWKKTDAEDDTETHLVFAGLVGLQDPPREGVKEAIAEAAAAGIRTVMVSGDSPDTAAAIGRKLGICDTCITGDELDHMDDDALTKALPRTGIFARVKPEDKLRIVRCWQKRQQVTAMTGDGVNDAPALKAADIGIGMGKTGSEVSKRVSALVLSDDNFATIVKAVKEGRRIYANIRKALQFLLASNLAEVLVIFLAALLGWDILLPIHLLWINLITDCFPAIALGMEPMEPNTMKEPPRSSKETLFSDHVGTDILWQGALVTLLTLASFRMGDMTAAFLTLTTAEICHAWNMRSRHRSSFSLTGKNPMLLLAMGGSLLLNLLLLYIPFLRELFSLPFLPMKDLVFALLLGALIIPMVEAVKFCRKGRA